MPTQRPDLLPLRDSLLREIAAGSGTRRTKVPAARPVAVTVVAPPPEAPPVSARVEAFRETMQALAKKHSMVIVVPVYEREAAGVYYNTAAVIDADGTYLGKYRKQHIPQVKGFWEKFYFAPGTGRPSKDATRNARSGDLAPFVKAARALIGARGRFCIVYPAQSFASLVETLRASGLEPKRARFVHATNDAPARVVTVEAMPAKAGGLVVAAPLIERVGNGYSAEMNLLVRGERRAKSI